MSGRLLRPLSLLLLAGALAAPLAAADIEIHDIRIAPAAPFADERVTVTVAGVSETPCYGVDGWRRGLRNVDLVLLPCHILPPLVDTGFSYSQELEPLAAGAWKARVVFGGLVIAEEAFTVSESVADCQPGAEALCLGDRRRFRVVASWAANGRQGAGQAHGLTLETGAFSFFDPENIEVVVKVIDGCALNGRFWVFATGLTDVNTVLTVTDTVTGADKTYRNPAGRPFAPIQDTAAFACL
ncbi:MAG TPA: hypothetical protein VEG34_09170 [Thermoanaerobaculia bacterium]|nr:hypothetical protein [Thermoanaerobaculia bacterium]